MNFQYEICLDPFGYELHGLPARGFLPVSSGGINFFPPFSCRFAERPPRRGDFVTIGGLIPARVRLTGRAVDRMTPGSGYCVGVYARIR